MRPALTQRRDHSSTRTDVPPWTHASARDVSADLLPRTTPRPTSVASRPFPVKRHGRTGSHPRRLHGCRRRNIDRAGKVAAADRPVVLRRRDNERRRVEKRKWISFIARRTFQRREGHCRGVTTRRWRRCRVRWARRLGRFPRANVRRHDPCPRPARSKRRHLPSKSRAGSPIR